MTLIPKIIDNLSLTTDVATMITIAVAVEVAVIEVVATSNNAKKTTKPSSMTRSNFQSPKATQTQTKSGKMTFKRLISVHNVEATVAEAATTKSQLRKPRPPPQTTTHSLESLAAY